MKEIRAYVQPFVLGRLVQSLMEIPGFPGMSVLDCDGFGRVLVDSGQSFDPFISKKRIEIIVEDDMVDQVVGIIVSRAHTGRPGDGRIFLFDVLESISIRTGERHSGG
ncbi:MAG TPA: P-II family nitrogen regulator [Methylococcaceae bacterium]|jgi:nitrogen regulatory protein PII|nr:P-II family nitrogen regulator [Methylococcaceae bacterium]